MKRWRCSFFKWQNFLIRPPTQQLTQHQRASSNITHHFQQHPTLITRRNPTLPTRRYPSTPIVAEHQPTLTKSWITYPTLRSITLRHPKSSNQHYPTSSNITQHHPPNITWPYPISSNIIQSTLCNVSQYYPTNIIQYHPTSPNQHYTTSSYIPPNITQYHPTLPIINHPYPAAPSFIAHYPTLPDINQHHPTSRMLTSSQKLRLQSVSSFLILSICLLLCLLCYLNFSSLFFIYIAHDWIF